MIMLTREQLEERLAALHQASLELVSNLSLEVVLQRIVKLAKEQVNAQYAALGILDSNGKLGTFVHIGMTKKQVKRLPHLPVGLGMIGAIQLERQTIRIPEIKDDPRSSGFPEGHPEMHSFLGVPILSGDRLLGQIYLTNKIEHPEFTKEDERVIETLAAYAAIAIENARLYQVALERDIALQQRNEDLSLLNELAETLASSLETDDILKKTLSRVIDYFHVEAGEIYLRDEGSKYLRLALHHGEAASAFWTRDRFVLGECFVGRVAQIGEILVSNNLDKDMRFLRHSIVEAGFRSLACIPLSAHGKVVGVMTIVSREKREFKPRELDLLQEIGAWAGTAIENAKLNKQSRRLAVLEERERIGMDLHDGIIQSIYAVGLALEYARVAIEEDPKIVREKIKTSIDELNVVIRDIRAYIQDLRPRQLKEGETITQGLERLIEEFRSHSFTEANLVYPREGIPGLPYKHALALFHTCQESLANIAKHANAKTTNVTLWTADNHVFLEISDDGSGFDINSIDTTIGHGLSNMKRRVQKVGGEVKISSRPMGGTTVLAWVPREPTTSPDKNNSIDASIPSF